MERIRGPPAAHSSAEGAPYAYTGSQFGDSDVPLVATQSGRTGVPTTGTVSGRPVGGEGVSVASRLFYL